MNSSWSLSSQLPATDTLTHSLSHLANKLSAIAIQTQSVRCSSRHVTVAPISAVERFLLQARWSGTHCQTIYLIHHSAKTLWTIIKDVLVCVVLEHVSTLETFAQCAQQIFYLLTYFFAMQLSVFIYIVAITILLHRIGHKNLVNFGPVTLQIMGLICIYVAAFGKKMSYPHLHLSRCYSLKNWNIATPMAALTPAMIQASTSGRNLVRL